MCLTSHCANPPRWGAGNCTYIADIGLRMCCNIARWATAPPTSQPPSQAAAATILSCKLAFQVWCICTG